LRYYQNKTSFPWSYRDSSKRSLKNNVVSRRGREKNTYTWDRWTCANGKEWSRGTNKVLVIRLHVVGKISMGLVLHPLETPNAFNELGSFIYLFIYLFIVSHIFFLLSFFFLPSYFFFLFILLLLFFIIFYTMWKTHFGNGYRWPLVMGKTHYRSSVTNESRKVTDRCPLLITHIRNGHQTTTVTTTSHRSREMAVSLGPQRTLVSGTKTEPVTVTQHERSIMWNSVSDVSTKWDTCISRASQHN
jgi:hypothetical protein